MPLFSSGEKLLAAGLLVAVMTVAPMAQGVAQQEAPPPDFSSNVGWLTFYVDFSIVPGGTSPLHNDPAHPRVSNQERARTGKQPNYFIPDLNNAAILKPWVVERMKKDNDEVLAGKYGFTPHSHCMPAGVPRFHLYGFHALSFI